MDYLNNLPYSIIGAIGSILIAKNLLNEEFNKNILTNIITIFIYIIVICSTYDENYKAIQTLIELLTLTLCLRNLFDIKISTSLITSIISIFVIIISEMTLSLNPFFIKNIMIIRSNTLLFSMTSLIIMIIGYLISRVNIVRKNISGFIYKFGDKPVKNEILMLSFLLFSILFFYYLVFLTRYIEKNSIAFIIFIIILCVLCYVYISEKNKYKQLTNKYNKLFEYACTFEEEMERDKLVKHEYKNQLSVIRGMTKNKKVINYIDDMLRNYKERDSSIRGVNNLPKGGLRGLILYKIMIIKNKKINFSLDISKSVKRKLLKLSPEETKILSYIIGVYCDNAIEECIKCSDSNLSIEVYTFSNKINIVISNTISSNINLKKLGEKGYTTKGKDHGNGLYLIKKLLKNNNKIELNSKVINNYFIQEIKINDL